MTNRMTNTMTTTAVSITCMSRIPTYIRSSPLAAGPVRFAVSVEPATDSLTMLATRPNPSCSSGVPTPPESTIGRYQAL